MMSTEDAALVSAGTHPDPFSVLGLHRRDGYQTVTVFMPGATRVEILDSQDGNCITELNPFDGYGDIFSARVGQGKKPFAYRLRVTRNNSQFIIEDPYRFGPVLGDLDEHLISEGAHLNLWKVLGAHIITCDKVAGTHFAVWAPNARRVSVVGAFNEWDGRRHVMRRRGLSGVWEIFAPGIGEGDIYKFELISATGELLPLKSDPLGFGAEHPPATASVVRRLDGYDWQDASWMESRRQRHSKDQPISIYEVHLGSWRRVPEDGNRPLSYLEHATQLVTYAQQMGFTHIELMPISEFPFDGSWGYQPIGLFAPTVRFGNMTEFRQLVDACHAAELGLILDWVPGHFPTDPHGLARFDGTPIYEHADPREGFHPDWNTFVYNLGRIEVANFLAANAQYWLAEHHVDGLRVDAVASMLYRDYSRQPGAWIPNKDGGRENLEAIAFLRRVNSLVYGNVPGIMTVAEESTAFPQVCGMADQGGLGFGFKWNMGWMNDTLFYFSQDPVHRKYAHDKITFGLSYAFSENFILPISHDEVVHGKNSMLRKMPGDHATRFANLRAYYAFMWGHPGKKLLFMGCEFAQENEWTHNGSLDWHLLGNNLHHGMQRLVRDLNRLYRTQPSLYQRDCDPRGFVWVEAESADDSVFAWIRWGESGSVPILVVCNLTPVERQRHIGVPVSGCWDELLNTDASIYGGGDRGNQGAVQSDTIAASGYPHALNLTLPPLSVLYFGLRNRA